MWAASMVAAKVGKKVYRLVEMMESTKVAMMADRMVVLRVVKWAGLLVKMKVV